MEKLHIQPSEIDAFPYYEYEYTLQFYNEILNERKDTNDKNTQDTSNKYNLGNQHKGLNKNLKNSPKLKMPKL